MEKNKKSNKLGNGLILVVEDEPSLLSLLKYRLEQDGFLVLTAGNGNEGLELAKKKHPNLILLDILMPEMNGALMLKELRKDTWGKKAKVIILTNLNSPEKIMEMSQDSAFEGIIRYYTKADFSPDQVVSEIKDLLN